MDLSNFVTYDKKESLLLSIAKSNLDIVENTLSKPQETLEFKMNKQKESFSFDIPLDLPEQWMMGVTSLEVYNTVYNITEKNNKIKLFKTDKMLKEYKVATEFMSKIKKLYETSGNKGISNIEEMKKLINDDNFKEVTLSQNYCDDLKKIINQINQNIEHKTNNIYFEYRCISDCLEIEIPPGAYELIDINNAIQQELLNSCSSGPDPKFKINIEADTISMKSVLTTSYSIYFNSGLNTLLGFTNKGYTAGTHISEKPVMITTTDKVHLKCDCVDGSIVNGIREQILFSFNLSAPPGYKIIKEPNIILYKKINKRLDSIQFFLEDNNHNPVDFNSETLTFTIQIIKI